MNKKKLKILSLFSGIGAFEKALTNLNINYELIGFSEIDKWAITSYCAIHNADEDLNLGDVGGIKNKDLHKDVDLITYGFPCSDISIAGHQKGIKEGTRSGLLYEAERIIKYVKPKYTIAENVKNLVGKRHVRDFELLLDRLERYGYNNYWKILNAKDFGIPQNRERVFIVSIRKDVDDGKFEFPAPFDNRLRLKDLLENEVEEKYYINNEKTNKLLEQLNYDQSEKLGIDLTINSPKFKNYANCIKARYDAGVSNQKSDGTGVAEPNELQFVGGIGNKDWVGDGKEFSRNYPQGNRIYSSNGIACSQTAQGGGTGSYTGLYTISQNSDNNLQLFTNLEGGKWDKIHESARRVYKEDGISPTIPTCAGGNIEPKVQTNYKIRKLTPLECWRLMGFADEDYWKARKALEETYYNGRDRSNSQMYKQAGNSVVVNVLEEIYKNLFKEYINI